MARTLNPDVGLYRQVGPFSPRGSGLGAIVQRMGELLEPLVRNGDPTRHFLRTYTHTNQSVLDEILAGGFEDPDWMEAWAVSYAQMATDAYEWQAVGQEKTLPWETAMAASHEHPDMEPVRHLVLQLNAHLNHDLCLGLLAVTSDEDFADPVVTERRHHDHVHVNECLLKLVASEHSALLAETEHVSRMESLERPLEEMATKHWVTEARAKTWANSRLLAAARETGDLDRFQERKRELGRLVSDRVDHLRRSRQVVLNLAIEGFGVLLPGAAIA